MKYLKQVTLLAILLLLCIPTGYAKVLYELDFSATKGDVVIWFKSKGGKFQGEILKINPRFESMNSVSSAFVYEFGTDGFLSNANEVDAKKTTQQNGRHPKAYIQKITITDGSS